MADERDEDQQGETGGQTAKNLRAERERKERADREADERDEARREKRGKRLKVLGIVFGVVALIVLIAVVISSRGGEAEEKAGSDDSPLVGARAVEKRYAGIPQDGFALGREDAPVRLVEFADLQCPLCKTASGSALPSLVDRYVKPGKVRLEFHNHAILGVDSEKAARAALSAAEQGKGWQFVDLWYLNQGEEGSGYVTDQFVRKIAGGIPGLDVERVVRDSNGSNEEVEKLRREGENRYGVKETPSWLIGSADGPLGQLQVQDPADPGLFGQAIDRQLRESD